MDDQKDKFPQDEDKNETDNSLIEKAEEIRDADTSGESERKNDSGKAMLTPHQLSKEYSKDDQKSDETKENSLHNPSGYKEIRDEVSTSNLDASLPAERSARQPNPILSGDTKAELHSGLENKSSENTSLDHQKINKEYGLKKEGSSKPSEEIVVNLSRIQKSTAKTPHMRCPSPTKPSFSEISLRIISPRRFPTSRRNSGAIFISDESPAISPRSTTPQFLASFFSPTRSTVENSNSVLQNPTAQGASVPSPFHLGNLSAHNFPNLEPSPSGVSFDRTSSFIEPLHSGNFFGLPSVNRPWWSPPNEYLPNRFPNYHLFPPNCSYYGYGPRHPIDRSLNYGMPHGLSVPASMFDPPFSQYDPHASRPTMGHSSSVSSAGTAFTTHNLPSTNTLTSSHCDSRSTSGYLTNPTTCLPPSRTPYSSDPVFSSADLSKLVDSTTVSSTGVSMPVSSANELLASGASVCSDISSNSERPSQESIPDLLKKVREYFTSNPVRIHETDCCPERRRRIGVALNLRRNLPETAGFPLFRESSSMHSGTVDTILHQNNTEVKNSEERGSLLNIPPSQAAKEPQISPRASTPKRAREEDGCSGSRHSDDGGRFIYRRPSRSSSISSDCSSRSSYKFRDEEYHLQEACEQLADAGISEIEFLRYAKAMFERPQKRPENFNDDLRNGFMEVCIKLGYAQLARLYNQLNKSAAGFTEHEMRLNAELSTILELRRRVSDGPPPTKSPKLGDQTRHRRTSDKTVRDSNFPPSTPSTSREESITSIRKVEQSNKSTQVDIPTKPSSSAYIPIVSRQDPQSINNQLISSSEMQSNDSSDRVLNEHSSEQNGSINNANAEESQMNEGQAALDNGSRIDTPDNESGNEETEETSRTICNVM